MAVAALMRLDQTLAFTLRFATARVLVDAVAAVHLRVIADLYRARDDHEGRETDDEETRGYDHGDQELGAGFVEVEAGHHEKRVVLWAKFRVQGFFMLKGWGIRRFYCYLKL